MVLLARRGSSVGSRHELPFDPSRLNGRKVPNFAIPSTRHGECEPMNGCPKSGGAAKTLDVAFWVFLASAGSAFDQLKPFVKRVADGSFGRNPSFDEVNRTIGGRPSATERAR